MTSSLMAEGEILSTPTECSWREVVVQLLFFLILCDPMNCSTLGLPVPHHLVEFAQVHVHWVGDAIQPSHPLPPSSPFAFSVEGKVKH